MVTGGDLRGCGRAEGFNGPQDAALVVTRVTGLGLAVRFFAAHRVCRCNAMEPTVQGGAERHRGNAVER